MKQRPLALFIALVVLAGCGGGSDSKEASPTDRAPSSSPTEVAPSPSPAEEAPASTPVAADHSAYISAMQEVKDSLNPSGGPDGIQQASTGAVSLAAQAMQSATPPAGLEADHETVRLILVGAAMEENVIARGGLIGRAQAGLEGLILGADE